MAGWPGIHGYQLARGNPRGAQFRPKGGGVDFCKFEEGDIRHGRENAEKLLGKPNKPQVRKNIKLSSLDCKLSALYTQFKL
jgi:hypothetical protein